MQSLTLFKSVAPCATVAWRKDSAKETFRLQAAGRIDHEHVFFQRTGDPIRNLQYPQHRWRRTLNSLSLRYRRPYIARHSSVSWNLMIGRNPLWVSKQHGHSVATMLRVYTAWAEGAIESDIEAIKRAMDLRLENSPAPHSRLPEGDCVLGGNGGDAKHWGTVVNLAVDLAVQRAPAS